MTVRPVGFNTDGSVDVAHDDAEGGPHMGTVAVAQMVLAAFPKDATGVANHRFFALPCPVSGCGSVTLHPIGGGAAPAAVQELFVRVVRRLGCPCGLVPAGRPIPIVQAHIKLEAERQDGIGRWQAGTLH